MDPTANGERYLAPAIFAPLATLVILYALKLVFGDLRVSNEAEFEGLDLAEHSETAYTNF